MFILILLQSYFTLADIIQIIKIVLLKEGGGIKTAKTLALSYILWQIITVIQSSGEIKIWSNIEWFGIPGLGRRCQQLSSQAGGLLICLGHLSLAQAESSCLSLFLVERGKACEYHAISLFRTPSAAWPFEGFQLHAPSGEASCVCEPCPWEWVCIAFCHAPIQTKSIHQFLPDGRLAWEDEEEQQTPQHVEGADDPEEHRLKGVIVAWASLRCLAIFLNMDMIAIDEGVKAFKDPGKTKNHEHLCKKDLWEIEIRLVIKVVQQIVGGFTSCFFVSFDNGIFALNFSISTDIWDFLLDCFLKW